jgi:hypothetical protein
MWNHWRVAGKFEPSGQVLSRDSSKSSEVASGVGRWRLGVAPALLAAAYLAAHLFTLAPSLEDIDSINFALALRDFDPAQHQPHPPGYPVYIALAKLLLAAVNAIEPGLERMAAEARALSLLAAIAGACAVVFAWRLFGLLAAGVERTHRERLRLWATILLVVGPLFWITGLRPMSDMPGLAAALGVQTLLLAGRARQGSFLAGLALGIRSQTLWLTAPLVAFDMYRCSGDRAWRERMVLVGLAVAGALCWAVPLVVATGGLDAYLLALGSQAGEDFAFVDMLWANPTPRRLAFGLIHTFAMPWGSFPLAGIVLALAGTGAVLVLLRERGTLVPLMLAFAPYAMFHLIFQETVTVRYALPAVVPVAFLAARPLAATGRAANIVATPIAVVLLMSAIAGTLAYASGPHPAFRAIADASRRVERDRPAMVTSHFELRRPLRAAEPSPLPVVYAPHAREWLELVRYWSTGGRDPIWFLANPKRADLDLIDPQSRRDVVRYGWPAEHRLELSGTRPGSVDWYRLRPPGWFLGEGWSLTPETGGLTQATGTGPERQAIVGYVRRHPGPLRAVVGGRHLQAPSGGPAIVDLTLDGAAIDRWTVTPNDPVFLRFLDLPAIPGRGGDYATLTIRSPGAPIAIRQFDLQPVSRAIFGYGPGWHDEELEPATGLRWRWTADRAVLRIRAPAGGVRLRLRGESPLRYFDSPPTLTVSAGARVIERLQPAADWTWEIDVPPDAMAASGGDVVIETNHVFVPSEITGSPDTRRLGLRVFAVSLASLR